MEMILKILIGSSLIFFGWTSMDLLDNTAMQLFQAWLIIVGFVCIVMPFPKEEK
jgi:hypothetical protein